MGIMMIFEGKDLVMRKTSDTEAVIIAGNGPVGILKDLGISRETLDYLSPFSAAAGNRFQYDGDFFSNLDFFLEKTGREHLKRKTFAIRKQYDFKFLNGIVLKSFLDRKGFRSELINNLEFEREKLISCLKEKPLAVVISTTFLPTRGSVEELVLTIRKIDPEVRIIAGGPHIYYSHKVYAEYANGENTEALDRVFFFRESDFKHKRSASPDIFIIEKRGQRTLDLLLTALKKGASFEEIPNLAFYGKDGHLTLTAQRPEEYSLSDHRPDWDKIEAKYLGPRISVQGSIGCPWKCKFCNFHIFFDKFGSKSLEEIREELDKIARRGIVEHIRFTDDNLFFNSKSVESFCSMLIQEDFPFTWSSFIRADSITPRTAEMLKASKVTNLLFGMESGDAAVLKNMDKKMDPKRYLDAIRLLNRNGISTESNLMVGFPGETAESVQNTVDLLEDFGDSGSTVNWFSPFVFIIFPFAHIDFEREKYGLEGLFTLWKHHTMNSTEAFRLFIDMLFKVKNLPVADRFITPDYQILSREEVSDYCKHRAKLNNLVYRLKECGGSDPRLERERDAEVNHLLEISMRYLEQKSDLSA